MKIVWKWWKTQWRLINRRKKREKCDTYTRAHTLNWLWIFFYCKKRKRVSCEAYEIGQRILCCGLRRQHTLELIVDWNCLFFSSTFSFLAAENFRTHTHREKFRSKFVSRSACVSDSSNSSSLFCIKVNRKIDAGKNETKRNHLKCWCRLPGNEWSDTNTLAIIITARIVIAKRCSPGISEQHHKSQPKFKFKWIHFQRVPSGRVPHRRRAGAYCVFFWAVCHLLFVCVRANFPEMVHTMVSKCHQCTPADQPTRAHCHRPPGWWVNVFRSHHSIAHQTHRLPSVFAVLVQWWVCNQSAISGQNWMDKLLCVMSGRHNRSPVQFWPDSAHFDKKLA